MKQLYIVTIVQNKENRQKLVTKPGKNKNYLIFLAF